MLNFGLLLPAVMNGLTMGAVYALIALGLTLIYGVLHIINFAHGSLLMLALYAAFFLHALGGVDPYLALLVLMPAVLRARLSCCSALSSSRQATGGTRTSCW